MDIGSALQEKNLNSNILAPINAGFSLCCSRRKAYPQIKITSLVAVRSSKIANDYILIQQYYLMPSGGLSQFSESNIALSYRPKEKDPRRGGKNLLIWGLSGKLGG